MGDKRSRAMINNRTRTWKTISEPRLRCASAAMACESLEVWSGESPSMGLVRLNAGQASVGYVLGNLGARGG